MVAGIGFDVSTDGRLQLGVARVLTLVLFEDIGFGEISHVLDIGQMLELRDKLLPSGLALSCL